MMVMGDDDDGDADDDGADADGSNDSMLPMFTYRRGCLALISFQVCILWFPIVPECYLSKITFLFCQV